MLGHDHFLRRRDLQDTILEAVSHGVPVPVAWKASGVHYRTLTYWMEIAETGAWPERFHDAPVHPETLELIRDFIERLDIARAQHEAFLLEQIHNAGPKDWKASAWYLEHAHHTRDRYHRYVEPRTIWENGQPIPPVPVRELADHELIDLADPAWAHLLSAPVPSEVEPTPAPPTPESTEPPVQLEPFRRYPA